MSEQRIICGDSLEVLPTLAPHSFSVAIADPPYIIGGKSIAEPAAKAGTWADMVNAATWYREWLDLTARCLRPSAYLLVFGNWRSLPTYLCAAARCSLLSPVSCMVWDKQWIGTGGPSQLRPRWELVLWLAMPEATIADRSAPDIESEKWSGNMATSGHPAEKPVALLARLLALADPSGGPVLDPFAGRGSAGLAARALGRDYLGIEENEEHAAAGKRYLEAAASQISL